MAGASVVRSRSCSTISCNSLHRRLVILVVRRSINLGLRPLQHFRHKASHEEHLRHRNTTPTNSRSQPLSRSSATRFATLTANIARPHWRSQFSLSQSLAIATGLAFGSLSILKFVRLRRYSCFHPNDDCHHHKCLLLRNAVLDFISLCLYSHLCEPDMLGFILVDRMPSRRDFCMSFQAPCQLHYCFGQHLLTWLSLNIQCLLDKHGLFRRMSPSSFSC